MIVEARREMMRGTLPFVEGSREISRLRWSASIAQNDPDILVLVAMDSETDAPPLGEVRPHRQPHALEKLQPEIEQAEEWARKVGWKAC